MVKSRTLRLFSIACGLLVAGCSGGSGGSAPGPRPTPTPTSLPTPTPTNPPSPTSFSLFGGPYTSATLKPDGTVMLPAYLGFAIPAATFDMSTSPSNYTLQAADARGGAAGDTGAGFVAYPGPGTVVLYLDFLPTGTEPFARTPGITVTATSGTSFPGTGTNCNLSEYVGGVWGAPLLTNTNPVNGTLTLAPAVPPAPQTFVFQPNVHQFLAIYCQ